MIYCFDIDGTLCTNTEGDYEAAEPFPEAIARVNALAEAGHRILLCTARGSTTGIDWRPLTEQQMARWGVRYDELHLGKPTADVYVDDKGLHVEDWRAMAGRPCAKSSGQTVAIIPARAGSKGVPNKNIRPLGGHPLLAWSIVAALQSEEVDRVIVSTDSEEYADIARQYGAEVPFLRPSNLALDHVGDLEVVRHAFDWLIHQEEQLPELVAYLRPTTPLRDPAQVDAAIRALREDAKATSLRSAHELAEPIQKMMGETNGYLVELYPQCSHLPRQLFPPSFHPDGYVDVLRTQYVQRGHDLYGPCILAWRTEEVCEVDRPEDFERLELQLRAKGSNLGPHLQPAQPNATGGFEFDLQPRPVDEVRSPYRTIRGALPVAEDVALLERLAKVESRAMHGQMPVVWHRAKDFQVEDRWGNRWIDFTSTIFVANTGHADGRIQGSLTRQLDQELLHTYTYASEVRVEYLEKLIEVTPHECQKAFLVSSGTEAAECGIKLMRMHGQAQGKRRCGIVSFEGAMHGRTMGAQLLGGTPDSRNWVGHDDPDIHHLPFPFPELVQEAGGGAALAEQHIDLLLRKGLDPTQDLCGLAFESYLGWGAYFLPDDYVRTLVDFARAHDALVMFDEIQSGFGRTGPMFAYQYYGVTADLVLCGKGMGGGVPLAAVLGRASILDLPGVGAMSSTHSANPLCCAAGMAVLQSMAEQDLIAEAARKGAMLHVGLERLQQRFCKAIRDTQGRGMVGALIFEDARQASLVCEEAMRRGLLLVHTGRESIKLGPPLSIPVAALREGFEVLEESLTAVLEPQPQRATVEV